MTDKAIIYNSPITRAATSLAKVFYPANGFGRHPDERETVWLSRIMQRAVPADATNVFIVPASSIPVDQSLRDAWVVTHDGKIEVDMEMARAIHRKRIRRKRKAAFRDLDHAERMARLSGDQGALKDVLARQQAARDAPAMPEIEAARTPDELVAIWPAGIPEWPFEKLRQRGRQTS